MDNQESALIPQEVQTLQTSANNVDLISRYLDGQIIPASLEEYVTIGFAAREVRDISEWVIGKLALEVTTKWGRGSLSEFCKEIGYGGQESSVNVYRWTAEKYLDKYGKLPISSDGSLLSHSFYQVAANTDDPNKWIDIAKEENLTIVQLKRRNKAGREERAQKRS